jgi:hypothetical protein
MNEINVGVFPCGSEVGLEINRALKYYHHFHLTGLSSVQDHGRIVYENYRGNLPRLTDANFVKEVGRIAKEERIRFLIPAMDEAGYLLKKYQDEISCEVVYPELKVAEVLRRKTTTYKKLQSFIQTPRLFSEKEEILKNLPVFVKPDIGYGSRGARKISSPDGVEMLGKKLDDLAVMEFLPGEEYTIDCFSSTDSDLKFAGARKRSRVRMGISVSTKTVQNQHKFQAIAEEINKTLGMKGVWFFQLKRDKKDRLTLLEIAGRVSGSMALYRGLGINFIASDLFQRLGHEITLLNLSSNRGLLERSFDCAVKIPLEFDTVYCDLDDCLITVRGINTNLIKFLYQCFNENKKLILITRHGQNPQETLKKNKLTDLFDKIIHIPDEPLAKASFIQGNGKAIFIDNSFNERQNVINVHNIPTFAPDAVDLLINKKSV